MKAFCVLFCVCFLFVQSVLCQFSFFPQREERAFTPFQLGQVLLPNVNRFQERISNLFKLRPESNRPSVVNDQPNNQFQQPNNQFQQPNNQFQQPNNQFQQPNNQFQQPNNQFQQPNNQFQQPNNQFQQPDYSSGTNQNQFNNNGQNYDSAVMFPSQYDQSGFTQENQPANNSPNQANFPDDQQYQNNNRPVVFPTPPPIETNQPQNNYNQQSQFNQNGDGTPEANQSKPEENSNTYPTDQSNSGVNPDQTVYQPNQVNHVEQGNGYTQDQDSFNQGQDNFNQDQDNFNQGQDNFNQGQDNFNQGQDNFNQGQDNFNQGQTTQGNFIPTESTKYSEGSNPKTSTETTTLAPLTPVPNFESRNFDFGPSGIFAETCQTVENEIGSCIPLAQCDPYWNMLKELKNDPSTVNLLRRAHCGFEGKNPKVCCPRPGLPTSPPETTSTSTSTTTTTTTTTTPAPVPEPSGKSLPEDFVPSFPEPPVCGVSNASFSRVVGGVDAKLNDFPWIAAIGYTSRRNSGTRWLCGGSLITSKHVMTAAHCIHNLEDQLYVVRLGELNLARDDDGASPIDVLIKSKIKHEDYNATAYTNDIGILVLDKEVEFTDMIKPICIPKDTELRARNYENYNPLIAGWGDTDFRGPSSDHLQVLQLPVVSNDFCKEAYAKFKNQKIDERVLCAGFKKGGKDACQGDSGGPLMQPIYNQKDYKTHFYQIGVVSFGKKCAEAGYPGVYSRVTHFVPWIQSKVIGN